jgi:hypothetical protein
MKIKIILKDPFEQIIMCWIAATILMLFVATNEKLRWLWWPIGVLILIGIVIYHLAGGPESFWSYNKKIDKGVKNE